MKKILFYLVISLLPAYALGTTPACTTPDVQQAAIIFTVSGATSVGEAEFSLSETRKVRFMLGNLQYQPSTGTWRIAARQYDYVGGNFNDSNKDLPNGQYGTVWENISGTPTRCANVDKGSNYGSYAGWVDLFIWGTGDLHGTDIKSGETFVTPTEAEFTHLVKNRDKAEELCARGCIRLLGNGGDPDTVVNGLILLPDNWDPKIMPVGKAFKSDADGCALYADNEFTESEWKILEAQGAIFLPAAGIYSSAPGSTKYNRSGYYWTGTPNGGNGVTLEFGGFIWKGQNCKPSFAYNQNKNQQRAIRLCQVVSE